ncbi:hypothetical protein MTR_4g105810 [Medicago truncatula]|uniref:Uncharacterized protein n=1 Tax=Medicago truncatula TaxID=3880 RepID=A0A072UPY4_MEDTR|nr:hypothetical protein MTR_4g105810 [Medicago truncatula]
MDKDPLKKGESRPGKLRNIVLSAINDQFDIQSSNQTKTERTITQVQASSDTKYKYDNVNICCKLSKKTIFCKRLYPFQKRINTQKFSFQFDQVCQNQCGNKKRSMATHLTKNWKMKQNPKEDLYIRESKLQGIEEVKVKNEGLPETLNGDGVEMKERVIGRNEKRKREWGKGYIGERKHIIVQSYQQSNIVLFFEVLF